MQIVVTELPIEDALGRARTRFQQADERLANEGTHGRSSLSGRGEGSHEYTCGRGQSVASDCRMRSCTARIWYGGTV